MINMRNQLNHFFISELHASSQQGWFVLSVVLFHVAHKTAVEFPN